MKIENESTLATNQKGLGCLFRQEVILFFLLVSQVSSFFYFFSFFLSLNLWLVTNLHKLVGVIWTGFLVLSFAF